MPNPIVDTIGAVCVCVTIVGNIEKFAILCFTPWVVEAILKASSRFKAESYGVLKEDGTIKLLRKEIFSLTHIVIKLGSFKEWNISLILIIVEIVICIISWILVI